MLADISAEAIETSRRNAARNGLAGRVSYMLCDATKAPPVMTGPFDLIVSNPPYIASFDILTLDASVRDYEPIWALDGGEDGLDFYRAIVKNWPSALRPGGGADVRGRRGTGRRGPGPHARGRPPERRNRARHPRRRARREGGKTSLTEFKFTI